MFEDFIGNEKLKREMSGLLQSGSLPHAVILSGKKGCGTGYFAKLLAMEYLRDDRERVLRGEHPDFLSLEGEGISGEIRIDAVRRNLYEISMASVMTDERRVVFIRHAEDLNDSSSNALLKAMEEPMPGILFLLTVSDPESLLPTIRSRAALYQVLPLEEGRCAAEVQRLEKKTDPALAEKLSRVFSGRLGMVLKVLRDKETSACYQKASNFCTEAYRQKKYDAMVWAASAIESREQYRAFLEMCSVYCGYMLRSDPASAGKTKRILEAVNEAYDTANSVNLKLSATRLAMASIHV